MLVRDFRKRVRPWHAQITMITNGDYRPPETVKLLADLGLVRGIPDLILFIDGGRTRLIEIKLERTLRHGATYATPVQKELHDLFDFMDHPVDIVRNPAQFWAIVDAEGIPHDALVLRNQETFNFGRRRRVNPG